MIVRSILRQLAWTSNTEIFDGIVDAMNGPDGNDLSDTQIQHLLVARMDQMDRTILVIDGIDHCEQPEILLGILAFFQKECSGKLWIMLTSRNHIPINRPALFHECAVVDLPFASQGLDDTKFFIANVMFGGVNNAPGGSGRIELTGGQRDKLLLGGKNEAIETACFQALCAHTNGM